MLMKKLAGKSGPESRFQQRTGIYVEEKSSRQTLPGKSSDIYLTAQQVEFKQSTTTGSDAK